MNKITLKLEGNFLNFNGTTQIPKQIFGVHYFNKMSEQDREKYGIEMARVITQKVDGNPVTPGKHDEAPANTPYIIDCIYDRYQPALILEHKDWKEKLETIAANFAKQQKLSGFPQTIEFWNEPYLNWADRPGVNYDPIWYTRKNGKIIIKTTGEETDLLEDTQQMLAVKLKDNRVHYLASRYTHDYKRAGKYQAPDGRWLPFKWEDNFEFNFRGEHCVMKNLPWFKDKTQKSYYSAKFNEELYSRMFLTFAKKLKEENPQITIIGGWDCNMWWDDWTPWETLFKPLIDKAHPYLDGITEHHYGCDTRMIGAEYEVAYVYSKTKYNKALKFYNTECGGGADPEQPGSFIPNGSNATPLQNFTYMLRDILHLLYLYPDKAEARSYHMPQNSPGGLDAFIFLKELRGELLFTEINSPQIWCVASLNNDLLCLFIFNDKNSTQEINLSLKAPHGFGINSAKVITYSEAQNKTLIFHEKELKVNKTANQITDSITIGKLSAAKCLIKLEKKSINIQKNYIFRKQFDSSEILSKIQPEQEKIFQINIPKSELAIAKFAKLRLVHHQINEKHTKISVNNKNLEFSTENEFWTSEIELPTKFLTENNSIKIKNSNPKDQLLICTVSIILFSNKEK